MNQKGFTVIELMIATSVFATVLVICTVALLQIGRTYYKGITTTRTQETAREIIEEVAQAVQYGSGQPEPLSAGSSLGYCIGGKRYSYRLDWEVSDTPDISQNQSRHALVADELTCSGLPPQAVAPSPPAAPSGREQINTRMRLGRFDVQPIGPTGNLYKITVRVVSGDNDLLTSDHLHCASQRTGGQFCAVSELSTVVEKRVK